MIPFAVLNRYAGVVELFGNHVAISCSVSVGVLPSGLALRRGQTSAVGATPSQRGREQPVQSTRQVSRLMTAKLTKRAFTCLYVLFVSAESA